MRVGPLDKGPGTWRKISGMMNTKTKIDTQRQHCQSDLKDHGEMSGSSGMHMFYLENGLNSTGIVD